MTSQAHWRTVPVGDAGEREFFDEHQWNIVEAATARIIPTDHDPGAREAGVVWFIDGYLAGHVYASADGSGFLDMEGMETQAWGSRVEAMRQRYTEGIVRIEETSQARFGSPFTALEPDEQDRVLVEISGQPKPRLLDPKGETSAEGGAPPTNQPIPDDELEFFPMLVLHTRQGFYSDPAYRGNRDHLGWKVIGFPGPTSLAQTQRGQYTTNDYLLPDATWPFAEEA